MATIYQRLTGGDDRLSDHEVAAAFLLAASGVKTPAQVKTALGLDAEGIADFDGIQTKYVASANKPIFLLGLIGLLSATQTNRGINTETQYDNALADLV